VRGDHRTGGGGDVHDVGAQPQPNTDLRPGHARRHRVLATAIANRRVRGSYFEACNCEAICLCRSVGGRSGGPSSFGECFGAVSWHVHEGNADGVVLSDMRAVLSIRYLDRVQPSTRHGASESGRR
jgi:hypothetical protein